MTYNLKEHRFGVKSPDTKESTKNTPKPKSDKVPNRKTLNWYEKSQNKQIDPVTGLDSRNNIVYFNDKKDSRNKDV